MNNQEKNDNAANRKSYVGHVFNEGEKLIKEKVLNSMPHRWAELHKQGYIHIHDLDAYGLTYNCLTYDIQKCFPYKNFTGLSPIKQITGVFNFLQELFAKIGNEQSGGMALANFDNDLADIFTNLQVDYKENEEIFQASVRNMILWCNNMHTRMGQTSYYVSLNIGLAKNDLARFLAYTLIDEFYQTGDLVYKPNIIFKVADGINRFPNDRNHDLLLKALECTGKKMIPTYLLCDCEMDKATDPALMSIMGCRTRVVDDLFGETGAIGRSNIDNISINLPRLALEVERDFPVSSVEAKYEELKHKWLDIAETTKDILLDRYEETCKRESDWFPTNIQYNLWCDDVEKVGVEGILKHGTLSIGFIGLSEMLEILFHGKFWKKEDINHYAEDFLQFMRKYVDDQKAKYHLNFSLLATSGELISGRFVKLDKEAGFESPIMEKGFYTNSFHVEVDSKLPAWKKIQQEGPFHKYCNGGCITYVELEEAPIGNPEGLMDLIEVAVKAGVHYLGFNFKKDVCNDCGQSGIFDECPCCGSRDITRIRRVSGYLEIEDGFTSGKKNEVRSRKSN